LVLKLGVWCKGEVDVVDEVVQLKWCKGKVDVAQL
jgi:hypothetical protein